MERNECYQTLGLEYGASAVEVKTAYRDLAKVWHPDRFTVDPRLQERASEMMKRINLAYETLQSETGGSRRQADRTPRSPTTPRKQRTTQWAAPQQVSVPTKPHPRYVGFGEGVAIFLGVVAVVWWASSNRNNRV